MIWIKRKFYNVVGSFFNLLAGKVLEWWPNLEVKSKSEETETEEEVKLKDISSPIFPYSRGLFKISQGGILPPALGDGLFVIITYYLPRDEKGLVDWLCFGERATIGNSPLIKMWGKAIPEKPTYKYTQVNYTEGRTWQELYNNAWKFAYMEMLRLEELLQNRQQLIREADRRTK